MQVFDSGWVVRAGGQTETSGIFLAAFWSRRKADWDKRRICRYQGWRNQRKQELLGEAVNRILFADRESLTKPKSRRFVGGGGGMTERGKKRRGRAGAWSGGWQRGWKMATRSPAIFLHVQKQHNHKQNEAFFCSTGSAATSRPRDGPYSRSVRFLYNSSLVDQAQLLLSYVLPSTANWFQSTKSYS